MEFLLVIWLVLLSLAVGVGFLMVIGKFSKLDRNVDELADAIYDDEGYSRIQVVQQFYEVFMEDFKNLQTQVENLRQIVENLREVSRRIEQAENLIGVFNENLIDLKSDVELLLRVDKEHPVLAAPVERSKGGRPRKEG